MDEGYYQNLPRKRMGAGMLFLNSQGEILIVKPSYKDHWVIPGGVVEKGEPPRAAVLREVKEEIGLDLGQASFICLDYTSDDGFKGESLQFVFFGGHLGKDEMDSIKLDGQELLEYKFLPFSEAEQLLSSKLKKRLPHCLKALESGAAIYLENGLKI